jgi:hypothetical protein
MFALNGMKPSFIEHTPMTSMIGVICSIMNHVVRAACPLRRAISTLKHMFSWAGVRL